MRRLPKKPAGRCDCLNTGKTGSEIMSGDEITSRPLCRRRTHKYTQLFRRLSFPNMTSLLDFLLLLHATDCSTPGLYAQNQLHHTEKRNYEIQIARFGFDRGTWNGNSLCSEWIRM